MPAAISGALRRARALLPDGRRSTDRSRSDERRRAHAARDADVVVFHIGMRINAFRKLHRWLPVFFVAPQLVEHLRADPDDGLLGSWTFASPPRAIGFVQYWESLEALRDYARDSEYGHVGAWREYDEQVEEGAIGIWHENYRVEGYETVYDTAPPRGLGAADGSELVDATVRFETAAGRIDAHGDSSEARGTRRAESERGSGY